VNTNFLAERECKYRQAKLGTKPRHIAMTGMVASKAEDGIISMMAMVKISFEYHEL